MFIELEDETIKIRENMDESQDDEIINIGDNNENSTNDNDCNDD